MTTTTTDLQQVRELMQGFLLRTAVGGADGPRHRYLWTDAFAVCNLLGLADATGERDWLALATALVDDVHAGLGRHHPDDPREGWLSGLSERRGRAHPTRGGLRIGKPEVERRSDEPFDPQREWDRDGQYFHYLTRWAHALCRCARVTGDDARLLQALELLEAAARFVTVADGRRTMHWKMSTALDRPLVASMGLHDPIDGLLTAIEVRAALCRSAHVAEAGRLDPLIASMRELVSAVDWRAEDPLGIGCLLCGGGWLAQLCAAGDADDSALLSPLLQGVGFGLAQIPADFLEWSTDHRLAFRELGLAIGLSALPLLAAAHRQAPERVGGARTAALLAPLRAHVALGRGITRCWSDPDSHAGPTFREHRDINEVMLATALLPDGYLAV